MDRLGSEELCPVVARVQRAQGARLRVLEWVEWGVMFGLLASRPHHVKGAEVGP